jgi:catalase
MILVLLGFRGRRVFFGQDSTTRPWMKYHFKTLQGIQNLTREEAARLASMSQQDRVAATAK